jgi:hypothetical protein
MSNARRFIGSVVVAAAAVSVALAIDGAGDGSALEAPRTLTLSTPFVGGKTHEIDLGRKGIGAGDMFLSTGAPLRDEQTGRRVGAFEGIETILSAAHNGTVNQSGAIRLRDGRIEVAGTLRHTDRGQALAIIGGTGAYANARGEVTERENERRKVTIMRVTLLP